MMVTLLCWDIATTEYVVPKSIPITMDRLFSLWIVLWGERSVPCSRPVNPLRARKAAMTAKMPPERISMDVK